MAVTQWSFPTTIRFGEHASRELAAHLQALGVKRPLVVGDAKVAELGFYEQILLDLKSQKLAVKSYHDFAGNPIEEHVTKGVLAYKEHDADGLVFLGGGAALDVGKAISLMVHHKGSLFDYEDNDKCLKIDQKIPPKVAIPTTSGTGSEVGRSSVISENKSKQKKIIYSPRLMPEVVLCDPCLTFGLPASITAATGVDALTHLIEAYVAKGHHPMCEGIALKGVKLVAENLVLATREPQNLAARSGMMAASLMGAVAFQKGLGITHSCAHALSTQFDLHHGLANAMMLPHAVFFNKQKAQDKLCELALMVGIRDDGQKAVDLFIEWLEGLMVDLKMPRGLASLSVTVTDALIDVALNDVCHSLNPRKAGRDDFAGLFENAM